MAKKKHKTPPDLDYLFERKIVTKTNYIDFWEGYWGESKTRDKKRYVDKFVSDLQIELPFKKWKSGTVTISRRAAEEQAKNIGGYVVRVTKSGRFYKRGRFFMAIKRRTRKKKV